jgi:flagellar biosynthetic protein FliR
VAGETVSLQTTLSFAQTANPMGPPTTSVSSFLAVLGVSLVFATDLHQLFIAAIVKSYAMFPAGRGFMVQDLAQLSIRTVADTFALGIQLAAPVIVFSLVFNIATGFIGRAMPQFQIFFVATPLQVLLGLSLFALSLGMFGLVWVDRFRAFVGQLV